MDYSSDREFFEQNLLMKVKNILRNLPPRILGCAVGAFVYAYANSNDVFVPRGSCLKSLPKNITFVDWLYDESISSLDEKSLNEIYDLLVWVNVDLQKIANNYVFKDMTKAAREVLQIRSMPHSLTLEKIAILISGVKVLSRERIRQLEEDSVKKFLNKLARFDHDLVLYVRALNHASDVLHRDFFVRELGQNLANCLFYVLSLSQKPKYAGRMPEVDYVYDAALDSIIVGASAQQENATIRGLMDSLPNTLTKEDLMLLNRIHSRKSKVKKDILGLCVDDTYHKDGPFMVKKRLSDTFKRMYVLERFYSSDNAYRVFEPAEVAKFLQHIKDVFGRVGAKDNGKSISGTVNKNGILCGRGMYCARTENMIPEELYQDIIKFIDNLLYDAFEIQYIYDTFAERLRAARINNKYYLYGILKDRFGKNWNAKKFYIFKDKARVPDIYALVREIIRSSPIPVTKDLLRKRILGITEITISMSVNDPEIINMFGTYIVGDKILVMPEEKEYIRRCINAEIGREKVCNCKKLYDKIISGDLLDVFCKRNGIHSQYSLFSVIGYLFTTEYKFDRPLICSKSEK